MLPPPLRFKELGQEFFAEVTPDPLQNPCLVHFNTPLANQLNLNPVAFDWVGILSGNEPSLVMSAVATLYAGHQFGVWNPQLGDGRAMLIAEHQDKDGNVWELQTKGGGETPFSRHADGRAVLRSSIREYLCSHAMASLGVPTTLALAIVGSDTPVYRETKETGAVVLRIAPSFLRFGHFEIFAKRDQIDNLQQLMHFTLKHLYPEYLSAPKPFLAMFEEIIRRTAYMIAKWQGLGFCHGVMNTDNMSILGLTLDYGPFGFMDKFDLGHICNHSDHSGRYAYANQPHIAWWNLQRLAESFLEIIPEQELRDALGKFAPYYNQYYIHEMGNKLGIPDLSLDDLDFLNELIEVLARFKVDWTIFWRQFSLHLLKPSGENTLSQELLQDPAYLAWLNKYKNRCRGLDAVASQSLMLNSNPALVPRNYMLHNAIIKAETGDFSEVERLFRALSNPYSEDIEFKDYYAYPPDSSENIILSCSS